MLIGISGKKGHGKSHAALHLASMGFQELSFAGPLKEACRVLFDFDDEQLYGDNNSRKTQVDPRWGFTPRWALQVMGTELFRDRFGDLCVERGFWPLSEQKDMWLKASAVRYRKLVSGNPGRLLVFPDVRYANEFHMIKELGGMMIRVEANVESDGDTHDSENDLDLRSDWDLKLFNDMTSKFDASLDRGVKAWL